MRFLALQLLAVLPFGLILCGLWLVHRPERDRFHLALGVLTAGGIAPISERLVVQPPGHLRVAGKNS